MSDKHDSAEWRTARARAKEQLEPYCVRCGKHLEGNDYTIDHIIPLNKGGTHDLHNLQAMCRVCNGTKQDKTLDRITWTNPEW
jgi:5-methylcytosine-specific restriction endonuclease McrA